GDDKSCLITNSRRPTLTVTKKVVGGANGHTFDLKIDGATKANDVVDGGTTGQVELDTGNHAATETFGNGDPVTGFDVTYTGDCSATGTITLAYGDDKSCLITNSRRPTLTVTKKVVGGANGHTFDLKIEDRTSTNENASHVTT